MEVILLERIEKIGKLGDIVKVKNGYARNYLLPQKKALRANEENKAIYEKQKRIFQEKNDKVIKEAQDIAKKMKNLSISIIKQASDSGQLYGSVSAREISDSLKSLGHNIQTRQVQLKNVIKILGIHELKILIHPEVIASIKVKVGRTDEELFDESFLKSFEDAKDQPSADTKLQTKSKEISSTEKNKSPEEEKSNEKDKLEDKKSSTVKKAKVDLEVKKEVNDENKINKSVNVKKTKKKDTKTKDK